MTFENRLRIITIILLLTGAIGVIMNTCALDRLETQINRNTKTVEKLAAGGGGGGGSRRPQTDGTEKRVNGEPGTGTGYTAVGWGERSAEILYVSGAVPSAPITHDQKPHPQADTYVNRTTSGPKTLNYFTSNEGEARRQMVYTIDRLAFSSFDAPQELMPSLATSWEVSEDKLTYIYHLRKGVLFADGRDFTSADVKFSFDVMRDPAVTADHLRPLFEDVTELTTPDPHTVVVRYRKPYWKGLYAVASHLYVLNKGWYEEQIPKHAEQLDITEFSVEPGQPGFGEVFNKMRLPSPGTGPYYPESDVFALNEPIVFVPNPFSWRTQVYPEHWNFKKLKRIFISDSVSAFEEFRKEKFDVTVVDHSLWDDELSKDPGIEKIAHHFEYDHIGLAYSFIGWNNRKPPFDDPKVRVAMTHLTNRQWILDEIERGRGSIATCSDKPIYPSYNHDLKPIPFDVEKARELLAEAGWTDTDGDGVLDKDGKRFEFEFSYPAGRRFYTQVGEMLGDACKQVGIRMTSRGLEWATFITDFNERRFDATCLYNGFEDAWVDPYKEFHSSQDIPYGSNAMGWHNDEADALLEKMQEEFDSDKRAAMMREFHAIVQSEQPLTMLVHGEVTVLVHKRINNATPVKRGLVGEPMWVRPEDALHE